jgi:hypothetical protein
MANLPNFLDAAFFGREAMRVNGEFLAPIPVCPPGIQAETLRPLDLIIKMQRSCIISGSDSK